MASGFVKVTLIGNLGKDPEVRFTGSGTAVANLSVGCTERVKIKDKWEAVTEWVRVVAFGKTAENAGQYLAKGKQVYVEGRLQTKKWKDKEGNERYSTEVVAHQVLFLGGNAESKGKRKTNDDPPPLDGGDDDPSDFGRDDDIPF